MRTYKYSFFSPRHSIDDDYFASRFNYINELTLIQIQLDAEFDSESNDDIFGASLRSKVAFYHKILILSDFWAKYVVSRFAISAELSLKAVQLNSTENSASNAAIFNHGHWKKIFRLLNLNHF